MKNKEFFKKWILLIIPALLLILYLIFWLLTPVEDIVGVYAIVFYIGFPILSIFTTIWFCMNFKSPIKYFSPLLLILLDFIWIGIFGDIKSIFLNFSSSIIAYSITIFPAVIVSIICLIINLAKKRKSYKENTYEK